MTRKEAHRRIASAVKAGNIKHAANHAGISDAAVHRWMSGISTLSPETVAKLAEFAGYEYVEKIEISLQKVVDKANR